MNGRASEPFSFLTGLRAGLSTWDRPLPSWRDLRAAATGSRGENRGRETSSNKERHRKGENSHAGAASSVSSAPELPAA